MYPLPGNIISTPKRVPAAPMIALPAAPDPPPPKNSIVGGPHLKGPTLQFDTASPITSEKLAPSITPLILDPIFLNWSIESLIPAATPFALPIIPPTSKVPRISGATIPSDWLHDWTSEQLGAAAQERKERTLLATSVRSSTISLTPPTDERNDLIGPRIAPTAPSIIPLTFPNKELTKLLIAQRGALISLLIAWLKKLPTILERLAAIFPKAHERSSKALSSFFFASVNLDMGRLL